METHKEELLNTLKNLTEDEFNEFKWYLEDDDILEGFKGIPRAQLKKAGRQDTVDLMVQKHQDHGALQLTMKVLEKINRNDLVQRLQNSPSEPKGAAPGDQFLPVPVDKGTDKSINPNIPVFDGGRKPEHPAETHTNTGRTCKVHTERTPGHSCCEATVQTTESPCCPDAETGLQDVSEYKKSLRKKCQHVTEGIDEDERPLLNDIYNELHITEGTNKETRHDTPIKCHEIFTVLPNQPKHIIEVVLTNGVAGVGKTFLVQKFTLDWAEGSENQDVSLVIPLSFRELNLIKDEQYSLLMLIHEFHPTLKEVTAENLKSKDCKVLFIFDGLDESRLSLDFNNRKVVSDVTQQSSVNVLLTNLIKKKLLPSALIWITSRPAAANQIPLTCVNRITEVRGFTDVQKEEYFRKRFSDEKLSSRIISHIKTSRSLHIMCYIPVFCWIIAAVLEQMLTTDQRRELPKTLTNLYSHFLLVQTKRKKNKYDEGHETSPQELMEADREVLLKLGKLAFEQLEKGKHRFYQEDLEQCGLDVTEASVLSGFCTKIFRRENGIFKKTVYSFVHLSIQEFLAAVYMYHCYTNRKTKVLKDFLGKYYKHRESKLKSFLKKIVVSFRKSDSHDPSDSNHDYPSLDHFLKGAMKKSLKSKNGHLDLFVRFLHGLSLESNRSLLGGLLGQTENSPETIQRVINNLWKMYIFSPGRRINIFQCRMEMNDLSVHQKIQKLLKFENRSEKKKRNN